MGFQEEIARLQAQIDDIDLNSPHRKDGSLSVRFEYLRGKLQRELDKARKWLEVAEPAESGGWVTMDGENEATRAS